MAQKISSRGERPAPVNPGAVKLGDSMALRLAAVSGLAAADLKGLTVTDVTQKFPHLIDPALLFFRRVCGRVVKTDPATGIDYPVPFATVQVEDTDCSYLGYFPPGGPWGWYFPFRCRREVIATAKTDECGNFCVLIPRWDIDWVLRFRRERRCYGVIFDRPSIRDLIEKLRPRVDIDWPPRPIPEPDPPPYFDPLDRAALLSKAAHAYGAPVAARIESLSGESGFGAPIGDLAANHMGAAPLTHLSPQLPPELKALKSVSGGGGKKGEAALKEAHAAVLTQLAGRVALDPKMLAGLDLRRWVGPFFRCYDVFVPVWVPLFDIPDITFRVLQDTDGDGDEEVIYGESHFDVRWNAGAIPDQVIHAWPNARAGNLCGPTNIPCGNQPAIVMAGRLPVTGDPLVFDSTLGDPSAGYAVRTNRPRTGGSFTGVPLLGRSPLWRTLALYGCNKTNARATHYRIMYRYSSDGGATFTAPAPFIGLMWPLYRLNGVGIGEWHFPTADAQGWYPIALPAGPNPWLPQDLLLDWPTQHYADGLYALTLELGTGGAMLSSSTPEVAIVVDNTLPTGPISVDYGFAAGGPFVPIGGICPVVNRGATPKDVYFRVRLEAAARHLRSAQLSAHGCGAGNFEFISGNGGEHVVGSTTYRHWHQDPDDNDQLLEVIYRLPAGAAQGTYSFSAYVVGRAFNPSGGDGGHLAVPPWVYDPDHAWINPWAPFSVFNAD
jgi:hypothetical protein